MRRTAIILLVVGLIAAACGGTPAVDDTSAGAVENTHSEEETHADEDSSAVAVEETHSVEVAHSDEEAGDDGGEVREIEVVTSEFAFSPTSFTVTEGETVRFIVHNEGVAPHEFRLTTPDEAQDHIAAGHADHGGESGDHAEAVVLVDPGATEILEVMFHDSAEYTMAACLLPGHFEAGMKAELEIQ